MLSLELFIFIVSVILEVSLLLLLGSIFKKLILFTESEYKLSQKDNQTLGWNDKLSS